MKRCSRAILLAVLLLVTGVPGPAARAETADEARAAARRAAAEVETLQPRVDAALRAYERSLSRLATSVGRSVAADQDADAAAAVAEEHRRRADRRVRALYMAGGSAALYASVLDATSASDALRRVAYVQRLVQSGAAEARTTAATSVRKRTHAGALERRTDQRVVTAADVSQRYDELDAVLAEAGDRLARLSRRARSLEEAEAAAAQLRAVLAAASGATATRVAQARAAEVPQAFRRLYDGAAKTCQGLSWTVLAAIGQVESGHGQNTATSYAGAQGPMQFLPSTFATYGVDGDGDGDRDIQDPADAIFSAAHYLCANGAGRGDAALYNAIWHYNHADWYVQLVLKIAAQLAERKS